MPNGNGMGPAGAGPQTGRGMGYCAGNEMPGWQAGTGGGRGMGRGFRCGGRGMGRGFGRGAAPAAVEQPSETTSLRDELEALRMQVAALGRQLAEKKCEG